MYIVVVKDVFFEGNFEAYISDTKEEAINCFNYYKGTHFVTLYEAKEIDKGVLI